MSALARVDHLLGRRVSMRAMALLRVLVGPVVLLHLQPFVSDALRGRTYQDRFHEPYAAWYPDLPEPLYAALLLVGVVAAVAMTIGWHARAATVTAFAVVAYNVALSTTHVHNNRAYLVVVLGALALTPCDRELSLDARRRRRDGQAAAPTVSPAWPLWVLRFEAAVVYGASGLSKLLDPDWFGGEVTWHRVQRTRDQLAASPLPGWSIDLLEDRTFHTFAAKLIVATELFIALGLWSRRTRYAAVWVAVCFHVAIDVSARVQVFSYLAIAVLVVWAVPSTHDRTLVVDPTSAAHRRLAGVVRWLDWLARFHVQHGAPGVPVRVVDRDGSVRTGVGAVLFALSRLPLTAWATLPTLLVARGRTPTSTASLTTAGTSA